MRICLCGVNWQAVAALGTWFACILSLLGMLRHCIIKVKVKPEFDGYKIFNNNFVNLIDISVTNKSVNAIYIEWFGLKIEYKCPKWYTERYDNAHVPFYHKSLPLCLLPGQCVHLFINTKRFCDAMYLESINTNIKVRAVIELSDGQTKRSSKSIPISILSKYAVRTIDDVHVMTRFDENEDKQYNSN